jgi:uncharacterized protein (DUF1697 family)
MPVYIALLRGVNVGQNILKMDRLRALCADLGVKNARTYVQSGNIIFEAKGSSAHWAQALERKLAGESRLAVSVIVRTTAEMARVLVANPFLKEKGIDPAKLHVTFLQTAPARAVLDALVEPKSGSDRFKCLGQEIYLHCPDGYGRTKLTNNWFEKMLAVRSTTRNWNTVNKLVEMCAE